VSVFVSVSVSIFMRVCSDLFRATVGAVEKSSNDDFLSHTQMSTHKHTHTRTHMYFQYTQLQSRLMTTFSRTHKCTHTNTHTHAHTYFQYTQLKSRRITTFSLTHKCTQTHTHTHTHTCFQYTQLKSRFTYFHTCDTNYLLHIRVYYIFLKYIYIYMCI